MQNELQDLAMSQKIPGEPRGLSIHLPQSQNTKSSVHRAKLLSEPRRLETDVVFSFTNTVVYSQLPRPLEQGARARDGSYPGCSPTSPGEPFPWES